ncbi:MAG: lysophospholipid acyltransferase family protein [Gemmatimonadaceae bacterium]
MGSRLDILGWRAFDMVFQPWMKRRLQLRIADLPQDLDASEPVMLVANHVSWWDGFVLRAIQMRLRPSSALYTIALERELNQHSILRAIGGIGIEPDSPDSILRAVRQFQAKRRKLPDAVFGYFPQGCITASFRRPLGFRRGVELFARAIAPVTIVPVAIHIEPGVCLAPTAFVSVGAPIHCVESVDHLLLEREIHDLLDATYAFLAEHGESSAADWPPVVAQVVNRLSHRAPVTAAEPVAVAMRVH